MADFVLHYDSEQSGLLSGNFGPCGCEETAFESIPFSAMLQLVNKRLTLMTREELRFIRVCVRTSGRSAFLTQRTVRLLQEDLQEATARFCPNIPEKPYLPYSSLETCFTTLANAFGRDVYCSRWFDSIECPLCGGVAYLNNGDLHCGEIHCLVTLPVDYISSKWVAVPTEMLLASQASSFYLPRKWNKNGNVINRSRLQRMYDEYTRGKSCTEVE